MPCQTPLLLNASRGGQRRRGHLPAKTGGGRSVQENAPRCQAVRTDDGNLDRRQDVVYESDSNLRWPVGGAHGAPTATSRKCPGLINKVSVDVHGWNI